MSSRAIAEVVGRLEEISRQRVLTPAESDQLVKLIGVERRYQRAKAWALGEDAIVKELRRRTKKHGAQKRLAEQMGISPSRLSQIANGHHPVSDRIAQGLGFRRVTKWERVR